MRLCGLLALICVTTLACGSSQGVQQDVGEATLTESKADVRGCQFIARITASVDLAEFGSDRAAAMDLLLDRVRNSALHKNCDTVYLITVEDSTTRLTAIAEGYVCGVRGITEGGRAGVGGSLP